MQILNKLNIESGELQMGDTTKNQLGHIMMADGVKFKPTEVLGDIRVIEVEKAGKNT